MDGGLVHASEEGTRRALRSRRCSRTSCSTTSTGAARSPWASVRALRRRWTDLRPEPTGGRAGHGERHALRRAAPEAARHRQQSAGRPAVIGPCWGSSSSAKGGQGQGHGRSEGSRTSREPRVDRLDHAQLGCLDGAAGQGDQPLHGRMDAYFALAETILPFEKLDKWLRRRLRQVRAGRSGSAHKRATGTSPRSVSPPRRPLMGGLAKGVLARRWVLATPTSTARRLLAQDHRPERVHGFLP